MKFGSSAQEAEKEAPRGGDSDALFMRYLKDGDQTFRILNEPSEWLYYWEHFNPGGFPFPCNSEERDKCPGCQSDNPKMVKASRRVAVNAWDGQYQNVWKIPKTVADKLKNRFERLGTITDRDYTFTRIKTGTGDNARYDYDLEGGEKVATDWTPADMIDPEILLAAAYEEAWGDSSTVRAAVGTTATSPRGEAVRRQLAAVIQPKDPPSEPEAEQDAQAKGEGVTEITEIQLRKKTPAALRKLCETEGYGKPPAYLKNSDGIVDWMVGQGTTD